MWLLGAVLLWWISASESCLLEDEPYSWIVSLRRVKSRLIDCTGILIARNYVIAPMTCFKVQPRGGFRKGSEYEVATGLRGRCQQKRKGILVMGHPHIVEDRFHYNMAYLETEPFDSRETYSPVVHFPESDTGVKHFMERILKDRTACELFWYKADKGGNDFERNELIDRQVDPMPRTTCWNKYCPSGNRGCVPYLWYSDSYTCATTADQNPCQHYSIGAPMVCNGTVVGLLQNCHIGKPLMIQMFNNDQLEGISLYLKIASNPNKVAEDTIEQSEPDFPQSGADYFPTLGTA